VLLLDRAAFSLEKTCGDMLTQPALQCLRSLGLMERLRRIALAISPQPSGLRQVVPASCAKRPSRNALRFWSGTGVADSAEIPET